LIETADRLRLDYEQTSQLLRTLIDIRFKLLAFVPTIAGASVGLVGHPRPAADLLGVGLLGLVATLGIFLYELRNSQTFEAALDRAAELERELGLGEALGARRRGLFGEARGLDTPVGRSMPVRYEGVGVSFVYGASLAGWGYLVAWGALRALHVGGARTAGGVIGIAVGCFVIAVVQYIDQRHAERGAEERGTPSP
jgi:hypothetical protein